MEFKGKEEQHVKFAKDFKTFLVELQKYVKASHTTGLSWNPRGGMLYVNVFFSHWRAHVSHAPSDQYSNLT